MVGLHHKNIYLKFQWGMNSANYTPHGNNYAWCILIDETERHNMESINSVVGILHKIDRNNLFEDVIDLEK